MLVTSYVFGKVSAAKMRAASRINQQSVFIAENNFKRKAGLPVTEKAAGFLLCEFEIQLF